MMSKKKILFTYCLPNLLLVCSQVFLSSCGPKQVKSCKVSMLHMHPLYQQRERNITTICNYAKEAFSKGANIVVAPEMATDFYFISKEDVLSYAGIKNIQEELSSIGEVAKENNGYIAVGFSEIANDGKLYNSAVLFNKEGNVVLHERKRAIPSWNSEGDLPYNVYETEYGRVGIIICADSYVDTHAKALKKMGADMILSPVTWFPTNATGHAEDDSTNSWKQRAKENELWYVTCNRWGIEEFEGEIIDMNKGKSCVVSPKGEIVFSYMAENNLQDEILYYTIER